MGLDLRWRRSGGNDLTASPATPWIKEGGGAEVVAVGMLAGNSLGSTRSNSRSSFHWGLKAELSPLLG
jgi:hypothetical protein